MTIARTLIDRLLKEQKNQCAACWRTIPDFHVHHAIYTREKRMSFLDCAENLQLLCPGCHSDKHGYLSSWFGRCMAWTKKIEQGYDMAAWNDGLPVRIKDEFLFLGEKYGKENMDKS